MAGIQPLRVNRWSMLLRMENLVLQHKQAKVVNEVKTRSHQDQCLHLMELPK